MGLPEKPITRQEKFYSAILGEDTEIPTPITREEEYLKAIAENGGGGGEGTKNYNQLNNKPQINGTELKSNKTGADLGLCDKINKYTKTQYLNLPAADKTDGKIRIVG